MAQLLLSLMLFKLTQFFGVAAQLLCLISSSGWSNFVMKCRGKILQ